MKKTKNIKISEELHKKIKIYCAINSYKINNFIENIIRKSITINDIK